MTIWAHDWKLTVSDPGREALFLINRVYRFGILPGLEGLGGSILAIPSAEGEWRSCSLLLACRDANGADLLREIDWRVEAALQGLVTDEVVRPQMVRDRRRILADDPEWFRFRLRSLVADFSSRHLFVKPWPDLGAEAKVAMAACRVLESLLPSADAQADLARVYVRTLEPDTDHTASEAHSGVDSTRPDDTSDTLHGLRHLEFCYRMLPRRPPFRRGLLNGLMSPYDLWVLEKLQTDLTTLCREENDCLRLRPPWLNELVVSVLHDLFACHRIWCLDSPSETSFARKLQMLLERRPELRPTSCRAPSFKHYPRWLELCFFLESEDDDLELAAEQMRRYARRSGTVTRCWSNHYDDYEQSLMVSVREGVDMRRARDTIWTWSRAQSWPGGRYPLELRYFNFQPTSFYGGTEVIPLVEEIQHRLGVLVGRLRADRDMLQTPGLYVWAAQFAWLLLEACSISIERADGVLREWQHTPATLRERRLADDEYEELVKDRDRVRELIEPNLTRLQENALLARYATLASDLLFSNVREYAARVADLDGLLTCVYRSVFHKSMLGLGIRWREEYCILGLARSLGRRLVSYGTPLAIQAAPSESRFR